MQCWGLTLATRALQWSRLTRTAIHHWRCRAQVHSHGPGATAAGSFDGGGGANGTSSANFETSTDAVTRSVWAITSFDSGPVQRALPDLGWKPAATQPRDLQVREVPA